jgi:hypothetical protein
VIMKLIMTEFLSSSLRGVRYVNKQIAVNTESTLNRHFVG